MCQTMHALIQTIICGIQMLVRVFMTIILMVENLIRMILQTLYNFVSFFMQMLSLIPICIVFVLTARLKCFMCGGGGGGCNVGRGGTCDCIMSAIAFGILFLVFRATGVLDKIFYNLGYTKATHIALPSPPTLTPSNITEYSTGTEDITDIYDTAEAVDIIGELLKEINGTTPYMTSGNTSEESTANIHKNTYTGSLETSPLFTKIATEIPTQVPTQIPAEIPGQIPSRTPEVATSKKDDITEVSNSIINHNSSVKSTLTTVFYYLA